MSVLISIIFLFLFSSIFCSPYKEFHPLQIEFDLSNIYIEEFSTREKFNKELKLAIAFFKDLLLTDNIYEVTYTEDKIRYCNKKIKTFRSSGKVDEDTDLLIFPFFIKRVHSTFDYELCSSRVGGTPFLATLNIDETKFYRLINFDIELFRLSLLRTLTNILGFETHLLNKKSISTLYFGIPKYATDNYYYSQTIKKFYNMTNAKMPKVRVYEDVRSTYVEYWNEEIEVPDYMKLSFANYFFSVTELTMNLFRDLKIYRINTCDFLLFDNNCYRLDGKCFNYKQLNEEFFIEYHYNKKYLSNN